MHEVDRQARVVAPEEGRAVFVGGGVWAIHMASAEDTGGAYAIVEHTVEPGVLATPPHTHHNEDELSIVTEGTIGVMLGGEEFVAGPGGYVVKPRGVEHAFWNAGPEKARLVEIISPPGFERFFDDLHEMVYAANGGGEEPDFGGSVAELGARYGLEIRMEGVPGLLERHGLTFE